MKEHFFRILLAMGVIYGVALAVNIHVWKPTQEYLDRSGRVDCTPGEAVAHLYGFQYSCIFTIATHASEPTDMPAEKIQCIKDHRYIEKRQCHLPMNVWIEKYRRDAEAEGRTVVIGSEVCPLDISFFEKVRQDSY